MPLSNDLDRKVRHIFGSAWNERDGEQVPEPEEVGLYNDAVKLDATVLYADLVESTNLVDSFNPSFAAEIYKTYLHCASQIIKDEEGVITSFDGDRVMAIFLGNLKNTIAARCALKINHAVSKIINPALKDQYDTAYIVRHAIGLDTGPLYVARTGVRGTNDLVWVGSAANYAAKLCSWREGYEVSITKAVYDKLHKTSKLGGEREENMWTRLTWQEQDQYVYSSSWIWQP